MDDNNGFPLVPIIATGIGTGVLVGVTRWNNRPGPPSTPTAGPTPEPQPTPTPTPPSTPPTPPTPPGPVTGTFTMIDPNQTRVYEVECSGGNVDGAAQGSLTRQGTSNFFVPIFIANVQLTGTGPFIVPPGTVTCSGSKRFLLGNFELAGEVFLIMAGTNVQVRETLDASFDRAIYEGALQRMQGR